MGRIIGIVSLKGGVGKTSSVVALGSAIADFGKKVLLVDGDLSSGNLGVHFRIIDPKITLHDVLNRDVNPSDAIYNVGKMDIIPAAFNHKTINPLKLRDRIKYLRRGYDIILLDSSPSLNEETLAVMLASDNLFVVATPDYSTLSTTLKSIKMAKQRGTRIDGLILNKVYNKNFEIPLEDIEETLGIPVLAAIPHDISFLKAAGNFTLPFDTGASRSSAAREFRNLAAVLIGERQNASELKRFFRWVNPRKQEINREIFYEEMFGS